MSNEVLLYIVIATVALLAVIVVAFLILNKTSNAKDNNCGYKLEPHNKEYMSVYGHYNNKAQNMIGADAGKTLGNFTIKTEGRKNGRNYF